MANLIFDDYQGESIKKDGVCYQLKGTTGEPTNSDSADEVFDNCEECAIEVSPSPVALLTCNCEPDAGDPRINVTMEWSDTGVATRNFLGCTFTNGETKEVCPSSYQCAKYTPTGTSGGSSYFKRERWRHDTATGQIQMTGSSYWQYYDSTLLTWLLDQRRTIDIRFPGMTNRMRHVSPFNAAPSYTYDNNDTDILSKSPTAGGMGFHQPNFAINNDQFGMVNFLDGAGPDTITITWSRGIDGSVNAWGACAP